MRRHRSILLAVTSVVVFVVLGTSVAREPIPSFYQEGGLSPNRDYIDQHVTEKIDPFTGKLQIHAVDLFIPGNGGLDIRVQRSYSSVDGQLVDARDNNLIVPSPIGVGWTMHFGRVIRRSPIAICDNSLSPTAAPVIELPDGSRQILYVAAGDVVLQMGLATDRIHWLTTNWWRAECGPGGIGMVVYSPDGTRYEMTRPGSPLGSGPRPQNSWYTSRIIDRNGNRLDLSYTDLSAYTAISEVRGFDATGAADGRVVTFNYVNNALASVTDGARAWRYAHVYSSLDRDRIYPFLEVVQRPEPGEWRFEYTLQPELDVGGGDKPGAYSMRRIVYPTGGSYSYTYGRAQFSSLVPLTTVVKTKTDSDNNVWSFAYRPATRRCTLTANGCDLSAPGALDTTTVVAPDGVYEYAHIGANSVQPGLIWAIGLLSYKIIGTTGGGVGYEIEQPTFSAVRISNMVNLRPGMTQADGDGAIYAPRQTRHFRNRNGAQYITDLSDFDEFSNPRRVVETGPNGSGGLQSRTKTVSYFVNRDKWILRLPATEAVSNIAGQIVRSFDASTGNLLSENSYGVTTQWTYNLTGEIETKTDARGKTTRYFNYRRGSPQREEHPENIVITRVIDDAGNVRSETDGEGKTKAYTYDGLNRLRSIQHPIGNPVSVSWALDSRTITRGPSYQELTEFDAFGRVARVTHTDSARNETIAQTYRYDALGRQVFASYPNATIGTRTKYDVLGRKDTIEHAVSPDGLPSSALSRNFYAQSTVQLTNERSNVYRYVYRGWGSPDAQELIAINAPEPAADVRISRNGLGQPEVVEQGPAGDVRRRSFYYDARYFLVQQTDPEIGDTVLGRDEVGNMTSRKVGSAAATTFFYDDRNRVREIRFAQAPVVTKTYFKDDKVATVTNATASRTFTYDDNKNLVTETLTIAGRTPDVARYAYDGNDALQFVTYGTGFKVDYSPDAFGRPTRAAPYITSVEHHPSGPLKKISYANGTTSEIALNQRLWPETIVSGTATNTVSRLSYGYDLLGNTTLVTDAGIGGNNWRLDYDRIDRLSNVIGGGATGTASIAYDGRGNIRAKGIGANLYNYTYDPVNERLTRVSGFRALSFNNSTQFIEFDYPVEHDVFGNVTRSDGVAYGYNDANQLICARCSTANERRYAYDGAGNRVSESASAGSTYYMHGLGGLLLWESSATTRETKEYVYVQGKQLAVRRSRQ